MSEAILPASACRTSVTETAQSASTLPAGGFWGCESSASAGQVSKYVQAIQTSGASAAFPGTIRAVVTGVNALSNGKAILLQPSVSYRWHGDNSRFSRCILELRPRLHKRRRK